jgi:spermidine/putrescine transport system substrate-binding protein
VNNTLSLLLHRSLLTLLILFCQLSGASSVGAAKPAVAPVEELRFLNWPGYIDPEVVKEFEHRFNSQVTMSYFESDDARDDILVDSDGQNYDVVVINRSKFSVYRRRGWLAPLTEDEIPNIRHIERRWLESHADAVGYGVPYSWGTTGIAYRADLVPEPITRWQQILSPDEALRGKIIMVNTARDVVGMALMALGYSASSIDLQHLEAAEALLLAQKPYVKSYSYVSLSKQSELVDGRAWATMIYNGDALTLQAFNPNIVYVVPEEGSELWIDYLVVLSASPHQSLAKAFINFVNEPRNAARIARFVNYATPNKAAEEWLPTEFLQDALIYPSAEILKRCESYSEWPPRVAKQVNSIFSQLLQ